MKKYLAVLAAALSMVLGLLFHPLALAHGESATPEASAKAFYAWYIKRDSENRGFPLLDKDIFQYVAKPTVEFLRAEYKANKFAGDSDPFTKVQDYDGKDWAAHIEARPALMFGDTAVVPVVLGRDTKATLQTVLAFMRKQPGGQWKIIKVDDLNGSE
ncbi:MULTISPECIES: DUF3828 domain-containing protein [unclassified Paraburkholderia]|uniref:DUF3828 domain-containing protein n=1 Tax=unclassified Paraburkholderia TaxID=2615204 RepID=UPI000E25EE35|nr:MULTISPECIES: DUF3828 domain-containing protein [unclassified Paraburkholderia]REE17562.1 uncharacterized protein DUF3828 [Paraburkholderia sp. BL27I4N3]RKR44533.1 uncharacterized protein DUF3828 [Paraburkholderia sp. BL17N1]